MKQNPYKPETEAFKKLVEERGISIYDFIDLYVEYCDLDPEVRSAVMSAYVRRITPKK